MAQSPSQLKMRRRLTLAGLVVVLGASIAFAFKVPGCEGTASRQTERVTIAGREFLLEIAADDTTRMQGLSEREQIAPDGGMLFVFRRAAVRQFVMRDCFVDIDILYLDPLGTIVRTHTMTVAPPRGPGEGKVGDSNAAYEGRLKKYSSGMPAQYAIEIQAGLIAELGVKPGDRIELDIAKLKPLAK